MATINTSRNDKLKVSGDNTDGYLAHNILNTEDLAAVNEANPLPTAMPVQAMACTTVDLVDNAATRFFSGYSGWVTVTAASDKYMKQRFHYGASGTYKFSHGVDTHATSITTVTSGSVIDSYLDGLTSVAELGGVSVSGSTGANGIFTVTFASSGALPLHVDVSVGDPIKFIEYLPVDQKVYIYAAEGDAGGNKSVRYELKAGETVQLWTNSELWMQSSYGKARVSVILGRTF